MKQSISIVVLILLLLSCSENKQEGKNQTDSIFVLELTALDFNDQSVIFNVAYSIMFQSTTVESCGYKSQEEANDNIVTPVLRSVIRAETSQISQNEIDQINQDNLKEKINEQLESTTIIVNDEKLNNCHIYLGMFNITQRK